MKTKQSKYASYGNYKHGMRHTKFYEVWKGMKSRCNNKNHKSFHNYGAIGVNVCEEWLDFNNFYNDMYKSYLSHIKNFKQTTLDRIDNSKGYSKDNCSWATIKEQSNNIRKNILIKYKDRTQTLSNWATELQLPYLKLWRRIKNKNMTLEQALSDLSNNKL